MSDKDDLLHNALAALALSSPSVRPQSSSAEMTKRDDNASTAELNHEKPTR
jgi:hypothetical protein